MAWAYNHLVQVLAEFYNLLFPSFCTSSRKIPFASLFCMIFCFDSYMYIKPQGKKRQPLGTISLMQAERSYHFDHWLHVSKNSSALWFYAHFFMILYMYIALGQGQTTHEGQNFDVNRKASSLWSFFLQVLKESLQPLTLYTSFHDVINVHSCRSGADNPRGFFYVNRNLLSLRSFATS